MQRSDRLPIPDSKLPSPSVSKTSDTKWKVFVINLDSSTDRLAHMHATLSRLGLSYERIPAIDGTKLSQDEIKHRYSSFWFQLFHGRQMSPGELGCALSHKLAYRRIVEDQLDWGLVLEDDVLLDDSLLELLQALFGVKLPAEIIQLYFSEQRRHKLPTLKEVAGKRLVAFTGAHASAIAYLVSHSAAIKLSGTDKIRFAADKFSWISAYYNVSFCGLLPFAATPHPTLNGKSNIDYSDQYLSHRGRQASKRLLWKFVVRPIAVTVRTMINRQRQKAFESSGQNIS